VRAWKNTKWAIVAIAIVNMQSQRQHPAHNGIRWLNECHTLFAGPSVYGRWRVVTYRRTPILVERNEPVRTGRFVEKGALDGTQQPEFGDRGVQPFSKHTCRLLAPWAIQQTACTNRFVASKQICDTINFCQIEYVRDDRKTLSKGRNYVHGGLLFSVRQEKHLSLPGRKQSTFNHDRILLREPALRKNVVDLRGKPCRAFVLAARARASRPKTEGHNEDQQSQ
jgi:hypothetical protein